MIFITFDFTNVKTQTTQDAELALRGQNLAISHRAAGLPIRFMFDDHQAPTTEFFLEVLRELTKWFGRPDDYTVLQSQVGLLFTDPEHQHRLNEAFKDMADVEKAFDKMTKA